MSLYHDLIIDHYKNPRNFGVLENPDVTAQEANASCGDLIEFSLIINHKSLTINEVKWRGVGCAISTAAASLLSEKIQNSPASPRRSRGRAEFGIQNLMVMTDEDMVEMLGGDISPTRLKCATLALKALRQAIIKLQTNKLTN